MNILYPRRCPVCHQILTEKGILVCRACENQLHPIIKDYCLKCGRPVAPEVEFCPECRKVHREFDRGRGVFLYNNRMRQSLLHYKYYGSREYGEYYAASICRYMERDIRAWNPDVIIPVPLHRARRRKRGYNQAQILAENLGRMLCIPVDSKSLARRKKTSPQKKLGHNERKKNLKNAFAVTPAFRPVRKVLLVDDIYTTGNTLDAAAKALKEKGVEKVYFLTISIGQGD